MSRFGIAVRSMDVSDRMCLMDVLRGGGVAGGSTAMSGGCAFGSFGAHRAQADAKAGAECRGGGGGGGRVEQSRLPRRRLLRSRDSLLPALLCSALY